MSVGRVGSPARRCPRCPSLVGGDGPLVGWMMITWYGMGGEYPGRGGVMPRALSPFFLNVDAALVELPQAYPVLGPPVGWVGGFRIWMVPTLLSTRRAVM